MTPKFKNFLYSMMSIFNREKINTSSNKEDLNEIVRESDQVEILAIDKEKNREIMLPYISKYLSDKEGSFCAGLLGLYENKDLFYLFDDDSLKGATDYFQAFLQETESLNKSGMSRDELDENIKTVGACKNILNFLVDLEKFYKLFDKKGLKTTYPEMLSIFYEVVTIKRAKIENDTTIEPAYKIISEKLGENIGLEKVVKKFLKILPANSDEDYLTYVVPKLLDKFDLEYSKGRLDIIRLIRKTQEEVNLEEFEQNIGSPQKINIGDFAELQGYEFEDYLRKLFELMDYIVIRTQFSGDQGADLIVSKNNEKIVIQAKKYNDKVSNKAVQEIAAARNHYRANRAIVITNSSFTKSAIDLSLSNNVELWDGIKLRNIIENLNKHNNFEPKL